MPARFRRRAGYLALSMAASTSFIDASTITEWAALSRPTANTICVCPLPRTRRPAAANNRNGDTWPTVHGG